MRGQIIFYDDCEASNKPILVGTNGNVSVGWTSRQGSTSNSSIARSNAYARKGTYSYKHVLSNSTNDGWQYMKAELAWNFLPAGSPLGTVGDQTAFYRQPLGLRWMAASTLIPSSNNDFNTITSILFNTKPVEDDWPTPTYLAMEAGRYVFIITKLSSSGAASITKTDVGPVVKDQWEDWVMNRDFTSSSSGFVRLYKNGKLVAEYIGPNWKDDGRHSKEPYMQMGLYKWAFGNNHNPTPNVSQVEMYMDEVRFGGPNSTLQDFILNDVPPVNNPPVASITPNVVPTNATSATVVAKVTDDGTIANRSWGLMSGPNTPAFVGTQADTLKISNLIDGEYVIRYIAIDNGGLSDTAFVTIVKTTQRTVIFYDGAENSTDPKIGGSGANVEQFYSARSSLPHNTLQRVQENVRTGSYSYKFVLYDSLPGWQFTGNELVWGFPPATSAYGIFWQGVSLFIPGYLRNDNSESTFGINALRYNQETKAHYLNIDSGQWVITHSLFSSSGVYLGPKVQKLGPVAYDQWTDWAIRRNYTTSSSGVFEVWKNKQIVYTFTGPNYGASGTRPEPYFQVGIWKPKFYKAANPSVDSVYILVDNVSFGGNNAGINEISPNQSPRVIIDPIPDTDADTVQLGALVTDIDGTIDSLKWIQISGPSASIVGNGDTVQTVLSDTGAYQFQLIAVDNQQAVTGTTVSVRKFSSYVNEKPKVTVPESGFYKGVESVMLTANGSDKEGSVTYQWTIESGPTNAFPELTNANTATVTISGLKPGTYKLRVIVTDEDGETAEDVATIIHRLIPDFFFIGSGPLQFIRKQ